MGDRTAERVKAKVRRPEAVFTGNVETLLDSASYGVRWVLLRPASEGPAPRSGLP